MAFGDTIINWYNINRRDLPWRKTRDPYKIWLSEIILQQTRVEQGLDYYNRFIAKYPDIRKLASAKEDAVLKLWQGLGYYSRARNMHKTARDIAGRFNGKFPEDYAGIISLKGIGSYTAAAILSFAFRKNYAVVDGNVFRVLSRYLGIATPVNASSAKKEFYESAMELMSGYQPDEFNQAIMEFGALQCKPRNPSCESCPLNNSCYAFSKKKVSDFPVKGKKAHVRNRYFNYLHIHRGEKVLIRKRTGNDIWKNMYDFPMIETSRKISSGKLMELKEWKDHYFKKGFQLLSESKTIRHQLTHQTIYAKFYRLRITSGIPLEGIKLINPKRIHHFALPRLIEIYLRSAEANDQS